MILPLGTKLSIHNGQLLTSTGVPSLDEVLGGGLPIGTVTLVRQDTGAGAYAALLQRYYASQALATKDHHVMLCDAQCEGDGATADVLCRRFIGWQDMPGQDVVGLEAAGQNNARSLIDTFADENESNAPQDDDSMKIAWRYAKLGRVQGADGTAPSAVNGQRTSTTSGTATTSFQKGASKRDYGRKVPTAATAAAAAPQIPAPVPETATAYCHTFDLQSSVSSRFIHASHNRIHQSSCPSYAELLARIQQLVDAQFSVSAGMTAPGGGPRPLLRIAIADLGSVDWIEEGETPLLRFLHALRGIMRYAFATCMITLPAHLFPHRSTHHALHRMSDIVLELESFPSSPDATAASAFYAREYHGIFRVRKYPRLNSLLAAGGRRLGGRDGDVVGGAGQDLAFKCRRRRFCIETLHLPPDLADGKGDEKEGKHDQKRTTSAKQRASNAHDKNVGVTGGHAAAAVDW